MVCISLSTTSPLSLLSIVDRHNLSRNWRPPPTHVSGKEAKKLHDQVSLAFFLSQHKTLVGQKPEFALFFVRRNKAAGSCQESCNLPCQDKNSELSTDSLLPWSKGWSDMKDNAAITEIVTNISRGLPSWCSQACWPLATGVGLLCLPEAAPPPSTPPPPSNPHHPSPTLQSVTQAKLWKKIDLFLQTWCYYFICKERLRPWHCSQIDFSCIVSIVVTAGIKSNQGRYIAAVLLCTGVGLLSLVNIK